MVSVRDDWTNLAQSLLQDRRIVRVEYMSDLEAQENMWYKVPITLVLDNDTRIIVSMDDECNDGGSLIAKNIDGREYIIPVLRINE